MTEAEALVYLTAAILTNPRTDPQWSPDEVVADADNHLGSICELVGPEAFDDAR